MIIVIKLMIITVIINPSSENDNNNTDEKELYCCVRIHILIPTLDLALWRVGTDGLMTRSLLRGLVHTGAHFLAESYST